MSEFAGTLRERVTFERRSDDRDLQGGAHGAWRYDGTAWAAIAPLAAGDERVADTLSALPRWRVTVRMRSGVDVASRIVWRERYLRVRAVEQDPRTPEQMVLITEEQR